ncbi:LPPE2 [Symbiodinium pilosum]|uniref:LPPE2 protein n=1 Tax=Symbiodinium pilosum TaxID=2952 RepID=A0A812V0Q5_SYMPI|nr:LPPE2 [Symbiodinium pilosum]
MVCEAMDFAGGIASTNPARVQLAAGRVPAGIRKLDASSKWLVTAGQTAAVVIRHDVLSPYIVLGGIAASLLTAKIKRIVNQRRPAGSPLTDPGMPSSHALVATFMSVAWVTQIQSSMISMMLLASAVLISVLRVICGHHTWAQVGVGTAVGTVLSLVWMVLGQDIIRSPKSLETKVVYVMYAALSVLFLAKQIRKGRMRNAALKSESVLS